MAEGAHCQLSALSYRSLINCDVKYSPVQRCRQVSHGTGGKLVLSVGGMFYMLSMLSMCVVMTGVCCSYEGMRVVTVVSVV